MVEGGAPGPGEGREHWLSSGPGLPGTLLTRITRRLWRTYRGLTKAREEGEMNEHAPGGRHLEARQRSVYPRVPEKDPWGLEQETGMGPGSEVQCSHSRLLSPVVVTRFRCH